MKTAFYLWLIIFSIVFSSCEKNEELDKVSPAIPDSHAFDLDNDSIFEIYTLYQQYRWLSGNESGDGIQGSIRTWENCFILKKDHSYTLFNKPGDLIKKQQVYPYSWEAYPAGGYPEETGIFWEVIRIQTSNSDNSWPEEWSIESNMDLDYYYMGIRITNESSDQIGWIKLDIDKSTGIINIEDKRFTTEDSIVIEE